MNHPAIKKLYEIMPGYEHQKLDEWIAEWIGVSYATTNIPNFYDLIDEAMADLKKYNEKRCVLESADKIVISRIDRYQAPGSFYPPDRMITPTCHFLNNGRTK